MKQIEKEEEDDDYDEAHLYFISVIEMMFVCTWSATYIYMCYWQQ